MPRLCFSRGRQTAAPGVALSESVHTTCFACCVTPRLKQLLLFLSRVSVHGVSGSFFFFFPVVLSGDCVRAPHPGDKSPLVGRKSKTQEECCSPRAPSGLHHPELGPSRPTVETHGSASCIQHYNASKTIFASETIKSRIFGKACGMWSLLTRWSSGRGDKMRWGRGYLRLPHSC